MPDEPNDSPRTKGDRGARRAGRAPPGELGRWTGQRPEVSAHLLRKIFDHSHDGILLFDSERDVLLDANLRAAAMLDYTRAELLALSPSAIHPHDLPRLQEFVRTVMRQGAGFTDELSCRTRSGRILPAEISASAIELGERTAILAIVRDITERKRAEEALRRSERRHRTIYEHTPVMMHSIDRQMRIVNVNETWLRTLGYEREEVVGRPGPDFLTAESRRYALEEAIPRLFEEGSVREVEFQMVTKQGEVIDVRLSAVLEPGEAGEPDYSLAFLVDVTERKRMERELQESRERLARVIESAMDAIVTFEEESHAIRLFNRTAEEIFRCPAAQAVGNPVDRFLSPSLGALLRRSKRAFDRGDLQVVWAPEGVTARRAGGEEFPIEATLSRVEAAGELLRTLILRDVGQRRAAEATLRKLELEKGYLREELEASFRFAEIVGDSAAMRKVLAAIETVAPTGATVLITGETGTGKELVAHALHRLSPQADQTLVKVNCAVLPAALVESELFGHEKGAFTGATARRIGRFELADGGTIFLDEIGDLPLELQAKLLRVLQDGEFERVGGSRTLTVDARVIAATNRDLEQSLEQGRFRSDLFYRLNVFPIRLPPLRERREDIPLLARHFVLKHAARLGKRIDAVCDDVIEALARLPWRGNARELENAIERGVILARGRRLEPGEWLPRPGESAAERGGAATLDEVQRQHILATLERTGWVVSGPRGAARILGMKPTTLEARMKKLGIRRADS